MIEVRTIEQIVNHWFTQHPDDMDDVRRASFAYHKEYGEGSHRWPRGPEIGYETIFNRDPFEHLRFDQCMSCGRTRWQVRHDISLPPECSQWKFIDKEKTIFNEEEIFFDLIKKSEKTINKIINKRGLNGETLSFLHHTYGIDIEVVEAHIELTDELRKEYMIAWDNHCNTGGKFR
jgi:hypothetical protein